MNGDFPMGEHWAAQLIATVLPPSKVKNLFLTHRDAVASQLVRAVMIRSASLKQVINRVQIAYAALDAAFDRDPQRMGAGVDSTFSRLDELQQREFSFEDGIRQASKDDLERRFGSFLDLYEFTYEQYYRTLAAPYATACAIIGSNALAVDVDGRVDAQALERCAAAGHIPSGALTDGLNRHLRNSAAHHRYSVLSDDIIRLWDADQSGTYTWGPVEWRHGPLQTNVYQLSNTCSVLLLGLAIFDIANSATIRARGWGKKEPLRPRRRDIVKAELQTMAYHHGFAVKRVTVRDGVLLIELRVSGETALEQDRQIITGGPAGSRSYRQHMRTEWGPLRQQVYGFLQTTHAAHGGYETVKVQVTAEDGKTALGELVAPPAARDAMWRGDEIETIRQQLPVDTLADAKIPVIIKGPVRPQ